MGKGRLGAAVVRRLGSSREGRYNAATLAPTVPNLTILPAQAITPAPTHINLFVGRGCADADAYSMMTFFPSVSTLISL